MLREAVKVCDGLAIILSALIPVVLLAGALSDDQRKLIAATMAAVASISTTLAQTRQYRDNYVRFTLTWEALVREQSLYTSLRPAEYAESEKVGAEQALAFFIRRVPRSQQSCRLHQPPTSGARTTSQTYV